MGKTGWLSEEHTRKREQQMKRPLRWRVLVDLMKDEYGWSGRSLEKSSGGEVGVGCACGGGQFTKGIEDKVGPSSELGSH